VLAEFDPASGRLTMRLSSQMPTAVMTSLQELLPGFEKGQVRVVVGDVGGGFGMKTGIYPEDMVVAWAARALQRPVRWQAERSEDLVAAVHGRDVVSKAELALDANGRVLAMRVRSLANVGAYATATGVVIQLMIGPWVSTSIYDIQTVDLHFLAVLTNEAPTGAYRGAGRPEAIYLVERLFDAAAREMKLDPAELRRRNMIRPEQMPYTNPAPAGLRQRALRAGARPGLALADWNGFAARRAESERRGRLRGRGIATFLEWTGGNVFEERVDVVVSADGMIEIFSATQAMGQGIATSYAQLAVDVFGVPIEKIRILQGDTDRGQGFGSAGSRSLFTGGNSFHVAAEKTVSLAKDLAAEALEAAPADIEYRAGRLQVAGTDLGIDLFELAARSRGADPDRFDQLGRRPDLAERLPRLRGRDRPGDRPRRGRRLRVGQRHRQGRQPDDRARPGRRRRGAGHRPGALRAGRLRPGQRADADRHADGLRAAARRAQRRVPDRVRHDDPVPDQPARHQGRRRARHDRRDAGARQRGRRRARPCRPRPQRREGADAADLGAGLARARRRVRSWASIGGRAERGVGPPEPSGPTGLWAADSRPPALRCPPPRCALR
jgi:hypothetical protein